MQCSLFWFFVLPSSADVLRSLVILICLDMCCWMLALWSTIVNVTCLCGQGHSKRSSFSPDSSRTKTPKLGARSRIPTLYAYPPGEYSRGLYMAVLSSLVWMSVSKLSNCIVKSGHLVSDRLMSSMEKPPEEFPAPFRTSNTTWKGLVAFRETWRIRHSCTFWPKWRIWNTLEPRARTTGDASVDVLCYPWSGRRSGEFLFGPIHLGTLGPRCSAGPSGLPGGNSRTGDTGRDMAGRRSNFSSPARLNLPPYPRLCSRAWSIQHLKLKWWKCVCVWGGVGGGTWNKLEVNDSVKHTLTHIAVG